MISDCLEALQPLTSLAKLERVSEQAEEIATELETLESLTWALDHRDIDSSLSYELEDLGHHKDLLDQLCALENLATDARAFTRTIRSARRLRVEVDDVIDEFENSPQ